VTDKEFEQEVMGYSGMYPASELRKFIKYFVEKKHFSTFKTFNIKLRLKTWFDPKRKSKFKKKNEGKSQQDIQLSILKNSLGKFNPMR